MNMAIKRDLWLMAGGIILALTICGPVQATSDESRVLHFPQDRSMGILFVRNTDVKYSTATRGWDVLGQATGTISVPFGKVVRLDISNEASTDLSALAQLKPDDLFMLKLDDTNVDDEQLRHIAGLTGLEMLSLKSTATLGTGLKYLKGLTTLKSLDLSNTHVGNHELANVKELISLETLNLWGTPIDDTGMVHVGELSSLRELVLARLGIGDEGLIHLKKLSKLRKLQLFGTYVTDEGLQHVAGLRELRKLVLRDNQIGNSGLAHLAGLVQMEFLELWGDQITDAGLIHIKEMKKLEWLDLLHTSVTERGLVHVRELTNLKALGLPFKITETGLLQISGLTSLEDITIDTEYITPKGLAALSKLKSLIYVELCGNNMDAVLKVLACLPELRDIGLKEGEVGEGLLQLKSIPALRGLSLSRMQVTSHGTAALAELPPLQFLVLSRMELPSGGLWESIGKHSQLKRLMLTGIQSDITDADVKHLQGLDTLEIVQFDAGHTIEERRFPGVLITDNGLKYLAQLKSLRTLILYNAQKITDQGLQYFAGHPSLRSLRITDSQITEQGLRRLRQTIPGLRCRR